MVIQLKKNTYEFSKNDFSVACGGLNALSSYNSFNSNIMRYEDFMGNIGNIVFIIVKNLEFKRCDRNIIKQLFDKCICRVRGICIHWLFVI